MLHMKESKPTVVWCPLPSGNIIGNVIFHCTHEIYSLLSDVSLVQLDFLIFKMDPHQTFDENDSECWGDIHEIKYYILTSRKIKFLFGDDHVAVPLLFWIDKSHKGGNQAEPVSFTLGIFTKKVRQSPHAWRHLGCIPGKLGKLMRGS